MILFILFFQVSSTFNILKLLLGVIFYGMFGDIY